MYTDAWRIVNVLGSRGFPYLLFHSCLTLQIRENNKLELTA